MPQLQPTVYDGTATYCFPRNRRNLVSVPHTEPFRIWYNHYPSDDQATLDEFSAWIESLPDGAVCHADFEPWNDVRVKDKFLPYWLKENATEALLGYYAEQYSIMFEQVADAITAKGLEFSVAQFPFMAIANFGDIAFPRNLPWSVEGQLDSPWNDWFFGEQSPVLDILDSLGFLDWFRRDGWSITTNLYFANLQAGYGGDCNNPEKPAFQHDVCNAAKTMAWAAEQYQLGIKMAALPYARNPNGDGSMVPIYPELAEKFYTTCMESGRGWVDGKYQQTNGLVYWNGPTGVEFEHSQVGVFKKLLGR